MNLVSPFVNVAKSACKKTLSIICKAAKNCVALSKQGFVAAVHGAAYLKRLVIRPFISGLCSFTKSAPRTFAALIAVIALVCGTATVAVATGATAAYDVMYNGRSLGSVTGAETLAEAEILAARKLDNAECNKHLAKTSLMYTIVAEDDLLTADELSTVLINNSPEIITAAVLSVDSKQVAAEAEVALANSAIDGYLSAYKQNNNLEAVKLSSSVKVENVYTTKASLDKLPSFETYLADGTAELPVQTVTTVVETRSVAYKTVRTNSNKYTIGTQKVVQSGKNGVEEVTYEVCTVDGVVTEKNEISSKVITKPVTKKVIVGTKHVVSTENNGSLPMVWPVKRVERSYVSSYVGDGRGHKGMDIVAPAGTPIYAAAAGTVTFSGRDSSGYGKYIIIEHSNGLKTLYAHCSALYVTEGDVVAKGESIAAVGTTGRSTGNHLHFEVRKNGSYLNPANYIGSK